MESTCNKDIKTLVKMSDDELFDELRLLVNEARNTQRYDRPWAKALASECQKRKLITPKTIKE